MIISSFLLAFVSILIISFVSLIGIFILTLREAMIRQYLFFFVALAVGSLLGDAFIHLIPEAFETGTSVVIVSLSIIAGVLLFFILEKFLHWHHHGEDIEESHVHPVGKLVLFSDGVHNMIDGLVIGASFLVSIPLGLATSLAVLLHEIPQEVGDFMVLLHAGYSKRRALWLNFLSALSALVGLLLAFLLGQGGEAFITFILPLTAGGFIYIAVADLIPELHKTKEIRHSITQIIAVVLGVLMMVALLWME